MNTDEFDYYLPEELIAQTPLKDRSSSRLLVLDKETGKIEHHHFKDIVNYLVLSSIFHYEFVFIHPFRDGNGRMARFWQTAILGKWNKLFYYLTEEDSICKEDLYYKNLSQYLRSIVEEYARLPYVKRELIYYQETASILQEALSLKKQLKITQVPGEIMFAINNGADQTALFLYALGEDVDEELLKTNFERESEQNNKE